jgi:predicted transposase YdaD
MFEAAIESLREEREEAWAEGRVLGREEGREVEREEVARNALAEGLTPDFVQKITGLDMETIKKLAQG